MKLLQQEKWRACLILPYIFNLNSRTSQLSYSHMFFCLFVCFLFCFFDAIEYQVYTKLSEMSFINREHKFRICNQLAEASSESVSKTLQVLEQWLLQWLWYWLEHPLHIRHIQFNLLHLCFFFRFNSYRIMKRVSI